MELENILDEQNINDQELTGLKLELKKLSWWSKMMSSLAIIGGSIVLLFSLGILILESRYTPVEGILFFLCLMTASILTIAFSISVFGWAKKTNEYIQFESKDDLDIIAKKNNTSWRLGTFVFLLLGTPFILIISTELERDYHNDNYRIEQTNTFTRPVLDESIPVPSN